MSAALVLFTLRTSHASIRSDRVTQLTYNQILSEIVAVYQPLATRSRVQLRIDTKIHSPLVNATAGRLGNAWLLTVHGGLLRHSLITNESLRLILCHEIGHILGGMPEWTSPISNFPVSNSGQPDYYAAGICMKLLLKQKDNVAFVQSMKIYDRYAAAMCMSQNRNRNDAALCIRTLHASKQVIDLLGVLTNASNETSFTTPDQTRAAKTEMGHPNLQCRLDTLRAGALCGYEPNGLAPNESTALNRACAYNQNHRPRCWLGSDQR